MKGDVDAAALLGAAAIRTKDTAEAREAVVWVLRHRPHLRQFWQGHPREAHAMAVSPDGRILALAGEDGAMNLFDPATGRRLAPALGGHGGPVYALAFSPSGTLLASGGSGGVDSKGVPNAGEIRLWDLKGLHANGEVLPLGEPIPAHTSAVHALAFSPDGQRLASGGGGQLAWADPDGYAVEVRDVATGARVAGPLVPPQTMEHRTGVTALAFHPDGTHLAAGSEEGVVIIWDAKAGTVVPTDALAVREIPGLPDDVCACVASVLGRDVLALSFDAAGERLLAGSKDGAFAAFAWDADGYLDPHPVARFDSPHTAARSAAFTSLGAGWATADEAGRIAFGDVTPRRDPSVLPGLPGDALIRMAEELAGRKLTPADLAGGAVPARGGAGGVRLSP